MGSSGSSETVQVDMAGPEAQLIKDIIHDKKVVVFTKSLCPSCLRMTRLLDELHAEIETVDLSKMDSYKTLVAVLGKMTGSKSLPKLYIMGECIGGWDETETLHHKGGLILKLQDADAV